MAQQRLSASYTLIKRIHCDLRFMNGHKRKFLPRRHGKFQIARGFEEERYFKEIAWPRAKKTHADQP